MSRPRPRGGSGPLKSLRGQAADLLRLQRYQPGQAAQELARQGVPPADAVRAVNDALEAQYLRERRRARGAMLVGGGVTGVGLLLILLTVFISDAGGGVYVIEIGAIGLGLAELAHGLSLQPGPPPYLDE